MYSYCVCVGARKGYGDDEDNDDEGDDEEDGNEDSDNLDEDEERD